jgi:ComF family protein
LICDAERGEATLLTVLANVRSITTVLIDFCYPRACLACERALDESMARVMPLCDDCALQLAKLGAAAFCDLCGVPVQQEGAPCARCLGKGVPHFERIIRLGVFHDPLKHLIHQMKYHRRWPVAEMLAKQLVAHEPAKALLSETEVLVPVPLHAFRHIARGYNQAEVIARTIGRECGVSMCKPIARVRRTPMQTSMPSQTQRIENMKDAFLLVRERGVRGKHVVLVDDVATTGATLQSAARVLMQAKPASLSALVLAVADPKHQDFQAI